MIKFIDLLKEIKITPSLPYLELTAPGYSGSHKLGYYNFNGDHIQFVNLLKGYFVSNLLTKEEVNDLVQILNKKGIKYELEEQQEGNGPNKEYKYNIIIPEKYINII